MRPCPTPIRQTLLAPALLPLMLALAVLLPTVPAHAASCDLQHFGEPATRSCPRADAGCLPVHLPAEIRHIHQGAATEWVGLGPNDGRATWQGLDLGRRELVVVERYAGALAASAPALPSAGAGAGPGPLERRTGSGADLVVEQVRHVRLTAEQLDTLACTAAATWSAEPLPVRPRSDTASRLYLLTPARAQVDTGLGIFGGPGRALVQAFDQALGVPAAAAAASR